MQPFCRKLRVSPGYSVDTCLYSDSTHPRGMVRYELAVILRAVTKPELADVFKKVATTILEQGAVLRGLQNLGERDLPYRMRAHSQWFYKGRL